MSRAARSKRWAAAIAALGVVSLGIVSLGVAFCAAFAANATSVTTRMKSDVDGVDLIVSCDPGPIRRDYQAQTSSGVALTSAYARERGADKGLVDLMNEGGRATQGYVIPRRRIRAIVALKYDMDVLDRADLVFTPQRLVLVHTSTANAGIFVISEVYEMAVGPDGTLDRSILKSHADIARLLDIGLAAYDRSRGLCAGEGR